MKIKNLMIGMAACAALTSCTSDGSDDPGPDPNAGTGKSYVSFRIVSANGGGRADEYNTGTAEESKVNAAAFFFYDEEGNFAVQGITLSSIDPAAQSPVGSVSHIGSVQVILQNESGYVPAQVLAVLNMPEGLSENDFIGKPLAEAMGLTTANYSKTVISGSGDAQTSSTSYMMTNAAYLSDGTPAKAMCATPVPAASLCKTQAEAESAPVKIYVERVAAKAVLSKGAELDNNSTLTGYPVGEGGAIQNKDLQIAITGWTLAGTNKKSYALKNLDNGWNEANLWAGWNSAANFRSFWAKDPNYSFVSADEYTGTAPVLNAKTFAQAVTTAGAAEYCHENTFDASMFEERTPAFDWHAAATYALVAAQMRVVTDGTAVDPKTLLRYKGTLYEEEAYKAKAIADVVNSHALYKKPSGADAYTSIASDDLTFADHPDGAGKVKLVLTDEAAAATWNTKIDGTGESVTADQINGYFASLSPADGFKDGKMYYIIPIQHLNQPAEGSDAVGKYGVVRNHLYQLTVNKITKLGHAVWNPDEPIVPTDNPETYYLAAKLNILSWHIVNQNVDL